MSKYGRGFDRLNSKSMGDCSFTNSTRTFSVAPKSGERSFLFMIGGQWIEKTTTQSVSILDTSGTYYFYFDTDGVLQYGLDTDITEDLFVQSAITGLVYYDAVLNVGYLANDEQHGIILDASAHFNLHLTRGYIWAAGGAPTGFVDGSSTYTNIGASLHFDEDIPHSHALSTTHMFMYRQGPVGEWKFTTADNKVGHILSGDTYCCYNQYISGPDVWALTECTTSTDYVIYMVLATNLDGRHLVKVIGQQVYASRVLARTGLKNELQGINLEGLPSTECEWQFAYIIKRDGTLEDDGNGNDYVDLRGVQIHTLDS